MHAYFEEAVYILSKYDKYYTLFFFHSVPISLI